MKAPVSWIREYADLPEDLSVEDLTARLTELGLKLEALEVSGADITGPLVVGRVLTMDPEPQKNGKTINWCSVDVGDSNGTGEPQGIVCGAHNFKPGDLVVVVLPGGVLPGNFEISARKTYGHVSAGMICSARELGISDDAVPSWQGGIIVLPDDAGEPGQDAREVLGLGEAVIEFEINPDRAYALSLRGVAREAALGFGVGFTDPAAREVPAANDSGHPVRIEDPVGCPLFVARIVEGFDPTAPTPEWMAKRIAQAGMRPISLAVDVTNYVMLELGRPIHAYDADLVAGPIVVRRALAGERLTTLDGMDRELDPADLVVTDDSGVIGLGGVMGGESTEISESTSRVLVEAAAWDAVSMFRTGKRHRITSEAGRRNERGVDPEITAAAADRVVELLVELGGGTAAAGVSMVGSLPERGTIQIPTDLPARITGMAISAETTVANLVAVGCEVTVDKDQLTAIVPPWRPDLSDPFDLVEEVARIVGYESVPSVLPAAPAGRGLTREQILRRRVGRTLAAAGYVEVINFPFVGAADLDRLGLPADDPRRATLRLANPISSEQPSMTATLLPGLLTALARNVGRGSTDAAIFEMTTVTLPHAGAVAPILPVDRRPSEAEFAELQAALPDQPQHLALALCGERDRSGWWGAGRAGSWSDAIEAVRRVAGELDVEIGVEAGSIAPWHPGRCAKVTIGDRVIGHAGELHPRVCAAYGLPARSVVAEVDASALIAAARVVAPAPEFSSFPVAKEDVALIVAAGVPADALAASLREGAGELCESVRLFDVYTGPQVGEGNKSLAFSLRFRAPDRTLTEAETAAARDAAVNLVARRHGATQRA
jgi:phenylalanyl-tRNA synthetase beta chain